MNRYRCHVTTKHSYEGDDLAATIRRALDGGMQTVNAAGEQTRYLCISVPNPSDPTTEYKPNQFYRLHYATRIHGTTLRCSSTLNADDDTIYHPLPQPIAAADWSVIAAGIAEDFLVRYLTRRLLA